ncbi:polysaccharide ABC transporter permease, partial [Bifidobacterium longum]
FGDESLMGSTSAITAVYWLSEVWQHVGWNSIIYLAALAGVDTSLYEAAKIDGAGRCVQPTSWAYRPPRSPTPRNTWPVRTKSSWGGNFPMGR